jgi:hypothetical protein
MWNNNEEGGLHLIDYSGWGTKAYGDNRQHRICESKKEELLELLCDSPERVSNKRGKCK